MKKRFLLPAMAVLLSMAMTCICMAESNPHSLRIFTQGGTQEQENTVSFPQLGGPLSELSDAELSPSGHDSLPGGEEPAPGTDQPPADQPAPQTEQAVPEAFLSVTRLGYPGYERPENPERTPYGFIVKSGDTVTAGDLTITILSVDSSMIIFTTDLGEGLRISGIPEGTSMFPLQRGETLSGWNDYIADASVEFEFTYTDNFVKTITNPSSFTWDVDMDGVEEQATMEFIDNGNESMSGYYLAITDDKDDWFTWEAFVEGLFEITNMYVISGADGNMMIIDGLRGDIISHDTPYSFAVIVVDNELKVLY